MRLFLEDEGALDLKLPYEELATKVAGTVWGTWSASVPRNP